MSRIQVIADNIISPLGNTTAENFDAVIAGQTAIAQISNPKLSPDPFYASMFTHADNTSVENQYTRLEQLCIRSIENALSATNVSLNDKDTIFILSSTKGNIELIENAPQSKELFEKVSLTYTAKKIAKHFSANSKPLVISNACISGVMALITAQRFLEAGIYKHAVVTGVDVLSKFILSGFQCLHAVSDNVCKPFDKTRNGINLGECAATIVLSSAHTGKGISLIGGAGSGDANHISGPSRTGLELSRAVQSAMKQSCLNQQALSFISAHGTGTVYNDEMESKAFEAAGLSEVPVHSLKPHFGHTLGAAGVVESIITYHSLLQGIILPSMNCETAGVSGNILVSKKLTASKASAALKTASGFGGCNAAIVFSKN
ncbi:MAG: beta-ketoacyl synthase [Bacteroidetes bacterium]|nr:beta-ketoacyl synthase [Bacteroidota bacterium]